MGLTVQPSVIAGLASKEGFRGKGLLARFLYSMPPTMVGDRLTDPEPMSADVRMAYQSALVLMLLSHREQRTLLLTPDACAARAEMQTSIERRMRPDGDLWIIRDWANKLVGEALRICGVLHVSDYAMTPASLPTDVPVETWARAEAVARYFLEHAVAAFQHMGADPATELAKRILAWCRRKGVRLFTSREARRATHATAEEVDAALSVLTDRGLVHERAVTPTGGRPSPTYAVHPSVLTGAPVDQRPTSPAASARAPEAVQ